MRIPSAAAIAAVQPTQRPETDATQRDLNRAALTQIGLELRASVAQLEARKYITQDLDTLEMLKTAVMCSELDCCVTILGPTGTGKELIANIIHARRRYAFGVEKVNLQAINCSGIPGTLFESLLFGHVKGSFTGAHSDRRGLLEAAGTKDFPGTVFLDEIGDLPLDQQAKLLRVIQNKRITPVGDVNEREIYCRFVFATNKDLYKMVDQGLFREDLYYRITTVILKTKPLTQRPGDAEKIALDITTKNKWTPVSEVPLESYNRGNVRQLYNYLFRQEHGLNSND